MIVGGYYLYNSGRDNTLDVDRRAQVDARKKPTLDGLDRTYNDVKSTKADLEKEYGKEQKAIGKQIEVSFSQKEPPSMVVGGGGGVTFNDGSRWYGAFGGFGGLGVALRM